MPIVQRAQTINAGVYVENLIAGSEFEFAPGPQEVAIGMVQDTVVNGDVETTIQFGAEVIVSNAPLPKVATAGAAVEMDKHIYYRDVAAGGDRIKISVRNVGSANVPIRMLMQTSPLA